MPTIELLYRAALELPASDLTVINAQAHPLLATLCTRSARYNLRQHFRPHYRALSDMGLSIAEPDHSMDLVLLIPSKNKLQTLAWMAEAMSLLAEQGRLLMVVANRHGAKSYESALQQLAGDITTASRSKCRIFSAKKTADFNHALAERWMDAAKPTRVDSHGLISQPGLFSWDKPDVGSTLLLRHLSDPLAGSGMDLCCGYGLLAERILQTSDKITHIHLVDADRLALNCVEQNTAAWHDKIELHWLDAAEEPLPPSVEWIVCNPPFHSDQARDVELGQAIVRHACRSLRRAGRLYLVANRKLPYELILEQELAQYRIVAESDGYKIIIGSK